MSKVIKRVLALALVVMIIATSFACTNQRYSKRRKNPQISPFEITAIQREEAKENEAGYSVIDAGRGNPNWINKKIRLAFASLMYFANDESELTINYNDVGGQAKKDGIGKRFDEYCEASNDSEDEFLAKAIDYCVKELKLDKEELLKELVDGVTGNYYPSPDRCLKNVEVILNKYLESTLYDGEKLADTTKLFPTEGGSAAMVYLFQSLNHNRVLNKGDKIAIATPIFTPYLEIPNVNNYGLVSMYLESNAENNWDISDEEIKKIEDKEIKALFLVNPSNPASHALSKQALQKIKKAVEKNPGLIIITDDVYGTFVDGFKTLYSECPYNTILVYSYSKLYGVTGWRVGMVAMNEKNVVDELISKLGKEDKEFLDAEYSIVVKDVSKLPFIERLTADSRSISLYHTSGLSTPQQVFMALMSLSHLIEDNDEFIENVNSIINHRYEALMEALGLQNDATVENAKYYVVIDFLKFAENRKGEEFVKKLKEKKKDIDVLNDLSNKKGVVLMYGQGFGAKEWTMRISLANNHSSEYREIGRRMNELLDDYEKEFMNK